MDNPIVFISYSHDSKEHRQRVLALSQRLREDGIETQLDQYVNGSPDEGWPRWMLDGVERATFVLVVCTSTYYRRFRGHEELGRGKGVNWEGAIITNELYSAGSRTSKFVPVFLSDPDEQCIPEPLRSKSPYVLTSGTGYRDLYDFLLQQAGVAPVPIGELKTKERRAGTSTPTGKPGGPQEASISGPPSSPDLLARLAAVLAVTPEGLRPGLSALREQAQRGEYVNLVDIVAQCCMVLENAGKLRQPVDPLFRPRAWELIRFQAFRVIDELASGGLLRAPTRGQLNRVPAQMPIMVEILMAKHQMAKNPLPEFTSEADYSAAGAALKHWETGAAPKELIVAFERLIYREILRNDEALYDLQCGETPCDRSRCPSPDDCPRQKLYGTLDRAQREGKQAYALIPKGKDRIWEPLAAQMNELVFFSPGDSAAMSMGINEETLAQAIAKLSKLT